MKNSLKPKFFGASTLCKLYPLQFELQVKERWEERRKIRQ